MYVQVTVGRFDRLHDAIFDPAPLSEQLDLARFQGRTGLIAGIDERIASTDRGYVVVRGEAGVGKSALAAHLVWTRPCAYHFTRLDGGARDPVEARKSLAAQLIGAWDLAGRFTPGDVFPVAAQRPDWLAKVIRAAVATRDERFPPDHRRPLVLVVDGLDEAGPDPAGMGTGIPLGLPAPDSLPAGAYIVATSRYGLPLVALRDPVRVGWSQIEVEGADNLADMAAYLHAATTGPTPDPALTRALAEHRVPAAVFVATLLDRCRGVWIYLRYVLDEIRAGLRPPNDVACLPDGLRGYYELQIQHRWAVLPDWRRLHLPALAVLAALGRPISSTDLAPVLNRPDDVGDLTAWLDGPARAFLDVTTGPDRHRRYQVRHQSLRDLFTTTPASGEEPVDAGQTDQLHTAGRAAHRAVTTWLTPPAGPATGRRDWSGIDDYTRLRLPAHAAAAGMLDDLMSDPGFLLSCPPGQILPHRHTLTTRDAITAAAAVESVATSDWAGWSDSQRAWWLHVWARKTRSTRLADALTADHPEWPWQVQTAIWSGTTHRTLTSHTGEVRAVAVLPRPDGRHHIISASDDGTVRVWDPDTGDQLTQLTGHTGRVRAVAVLPGPDGRHHIISASDDGTVRVWNPNTGDQLAKLTRHTGPVSAVTVLPGPDGRHHIISASDDGTVRVWNPNTGDQLTQLTGHTGRVRAVTVLPGPHGRHHIISAGADGTVRVWDPNTGDQLTQLTGHTGRVRAVTVLPGPHGRHHIISASDDGTVRVWNPNTGDQLTQLTGHTGWVLTVAVLPGPDGRHHIISGSADGSLRVWDPDTGDQLAKLTGHTGLVWAVAVLPGPDGRHHIISGGDDGTVRVWDPNTGDQLTELTGSVWAVATLPGPHGRHHIISAGADGTVRVWDPNTGDQLAKLTGHTGRVWAVAVLPGPHGRHHIISAGADGTVRVWDPNTGDQLTQLTGHTGRVWAVAVLPGPHGRHHIISAGADGTVRVWDPNTGDQLTQLTGHTDRVWAVTVLPGPHGRHHIISASADGTVRVWDPNTGDQLTQLTGHTGWVQAVTVLPRPDGRHHIISASADETVRVWDPNTGDQLTQLTGHTGWVQAVTVLPRPDGRHHIISASADGTVRVWDPNTGDQLTQLTGHTGSVQAVAVLPGPDGLYRVVTGGDDRCMMVLAPSAGQPT
ncbi:WD40 repeat domain-containing protein [Solwaraspora sp. WMMD1047]|uniref:WD40 repeat domain-containing protein n=1 Tax=Solwaraspora sp. WMMD1047 TaxID=3016102 RepID=UPI0024172CCE|nr:WD40 repeat domain-containing protein [Solwaraspora sp. WMMD1047]MDG4834236.1 WD40 repeat domain-containing protein [Solwaraspora sp. WMMD1047]